MTASSPSPGPSKADIQYGQYLWMTTEASLSSSIRTDKTAFGRFVLFFLMVDMSLAFLGHQETIRRPTQDTHYDPIPSSPRSSIIGVGWFSPMFQV